MIIPIKKTDAPDINFQPANTYVIKIQATLFQKKDYQIFTEYSKITIKYSFLHLLVCYK